MTVLPRSRRPFSVLEQALVVALMQADAGFVEHVEDADEAGADLRGQPDALRFAAGERIALAVEREIVQADVLQERQARDDLLEDLLGDVLFVLR